MLLGLLHFLIYYQFINAEEIKFIKKYDLGSEEKKDEMFFKIKDIKIDRDGNIFILDTGDNCIKKFSKDKKFLKKVGRKGQGPGEMNSPANIDIDLRGNIYLNDSGNRRINVYDNDLKYIKTISLARQARFSKLFIGAEGNLVMYKFPRRVGDKYFHLFSRDGKYITSFFDKYHSLALSKKSLNKELLSAADILYFSAVANLNLSKTRIAFTYMMPENPMEIYILNENGNIEKTMEKNIEDYNPKKQFEYVKSTSFGAEKKGANILRKIAGVHFTNQDYLIIQRKNELYKNDTFEKFLISLDIYSPIGELIKEELEFQGDILSIDGQNNVYTRTEDEHGIPKITVYSLKISK